MAEIPRHQTNAQSTQGQTKENISEVIGPPTAASPQPPLTPRENNRAPKRYCRCLKDPATFWVTVAGVLAVLAYTTVAYWQLGAMIDANVDTHIAAVAARDSAKAALVANETTRAQIGAYLTVGGPESSIRIGEDGIITIDLDITNIGGTAARDAYFELALLVHSSQPIDFRATIKGVGLDISPTKPFRHTFRVPSGNDFATARGHIDVSVRGTLTFTTVFDETKTQRVDLVAGPEDSLPDCCNIDQFRQPILLLRDVPFK
jgi:hypothetical protein